MIVAVFLLVLSAAILVFLRRGRPDSSERPYVRERLPRLSLEDFTMYKYEQHRAVSTLSGRFANFIDPDTLEIFGSIQGFNYEAKKKESFSAESATVHFAAKGLVDLIKDSRIISTEIENQVKISSDDLLLSTDYAKFIHEEDKLISDLPVRIEGPQMEFVGRKGFEFNNKNGDLKVFGPLEGTMRGVEKLQQ